jgi:ribonuclease HII
MQLFQKEGILEAGVDEAARGVLIGRVYAASVVWTDLKKATDLPKGVVIRDSKKMSRAQRERSAAYIKEHARAWSVAWREEDCVDERNILKSTIEAMHASIDGLFLEPESILVDGSQFEHYIGRLSTTWIPFTCIIKGDDAFFSIACASILAKVEHDTYVKDLCALYPKLHLRYDLLNCMGYGTPRHLEGINKYGICQFHRKSFKPCANKNLSVVEKVV